MVRIVIIATFLNFFVRTSQGQARLMPISMADSMEKANPKPSIILLSAPWCKWCEKMKAQTFPVLLSDSSAIEAFNFFELNVESQDAISFAGQTFQPNTGDYHELALQLMDSGKMTLPIVLILDESHNILFQYNGFIAPNVLMRLLQSM